MFERHGSLWLARFHPSRLGVFAPSLGTDRSRPSTAAEALGATGAEAVLDGPMFARCDPAGSLTGTDEEKYAQSQCSRVEYRLYSPVDQVDIATRYPSQGMTISVVDGEAVVRSGAQVASGASVAVQLYPPLVREGRVVTTSSLNTDRVTRAGLAVMRDGQLAFVLGNGMSMTDFATAIAAAGGVDAGYTDGGGSGRIQYANGEYHGSSRDRRVGSWLFIRGTGAGDGLFSPGSSGGMAAVLITAGVGGLLLWGWQRGRRR